MAIRIAAIAAILAVGAFALHHPAPRQGIGEAAAGASPPASPGFAGELERKRRALHPVSDDIVVYVAGAVKRPGLYRLHTGDRAAQAVALAGGMGRSADAGGINLAQRSQDGDEIYVPALGETHRRGSLAPHRTRRSATPPPDGSIDVNRADSRELARVPGIGRSVAARIVELREREGSFTSLDELLDVAGMSQARLDRAKPYLREP
jgi:competence protein ComEA